MGLQIKKYEILENIYCQLLVFLNISKKMFK